MFRDLTEVLLLPEVGFGVEQEVFVKLFQD